MLYMWQFQGFGIWHSMRGPQRCASPEGQGVLEDVSKMDFIPTRSNGEGRKAVKPPQAVSTLRLNANFPGAENRVASHTHRVWFHFCERLDADRCEDCMFVFEAVVFMADPVIQERRRLTLARHRAYMRQKGLDERQKSKGRGRIAKVD